jgi:penicillin-binding protein 1C
LVALITYYTAIVASRAHLDSPPPTAFVTDRNGTFLAQFGNHADGRVDYGYWPASATPEVIAATLALEDRRFWRHPGVDPLALARALWSDIRGGHRVSGASTIAMQVAHLQHPESRTLWHKAIEAGTAIALTLRYGRQAVLEQYLRLAPYGNGSHGIAHAARFYFNKPVRDLSPAETALLVALPQSPTRNNPARDSGLAHALPRAEAALAALCLPAAAEAIARRQLAALPPLVLPHRPAVTLLALARLETLLKRDGMPATGPLIAARLDLPTEENVAAITARHLHLWRGALAREAAVMVVRRERNSGDGQQVVAAVSLGSAFDFTRALRSPGSTLKPFLYAYALDRGLITPLSLLQDLPDAASGAGNADGRFLGLLRPRQALANSRNVPAIALLRQIGLARGFGFLRDLGLDDGVSTPASVGLTLAIGGMPTSLEHLLRAYTAIADDGRLSGLDWYAGAPLPPPEPVLGADATRLVTQFLSDPLARLPSFPAHGATDLPFVTALKTGTSQGYRDAWIVAWSDRYLVGVWVGRDDDAPMRDMSGASTAGALARDVLLSLHGTSKDRLTEGSFPAPRGMVADTLDAGRWTEWTPAPAVATAAAAALAAQPAEKLSIVTPEDHLHLWRNPEAPARLNRLPLRVTADPPVRQIVWYVDDAPFAVADPSAPLYWPMQSGIHKFQARLPFDRATSRVVRVEVR